MIGFTELGPAACTVVVYTKGPRVAKGRAACAERRRNGAAWALEDAGRATQGSLGDGACFRVMRARTGLRHPDHPPWLKAVRLQRTFGRIPLFILEPAGPTCYQSFASGFRAADIKSAFITDFRSVCEFGASDLERTSANVDPVTCAPASSRHRRCTRSLILHMPKPPCMAQHDLI